MRCVYCEAPEIKERKIVQTKYSFAFPTNIPIVPGHVLVCPIRCVKDLYDLTNEEKLDLINLVFTIQQALKKTFNAEGFNIAYNQGEVAGQNIPHLHVHVLPRKNGDAGITEYEPRKFLYRPGSRETIPENELKEIAELIKNNILI
ncbi:MAG: HIT domain-containing protein [Nanoarchaeota archaeon]